MRPSLSGLAWAFCLLVFGCAEDDGRFNLRFEWLAAEPEAGTVELSVFVGQRVSSASPVEPITERSVGIYAPGVQLAIGGVPYGRDRIVVVRGRGRGDGRRLYTGLSEPFDFGPGDRIEPSMPVLIDYAPEIATSSAARVRVLGARAGRVRASRVTLAFSARGIERVELARNLDFSLGRLELNVQELTERGTEADGFVRFEAEYDLLEGVEDPASADGTYAIAVRGVDRSGERSSPELTSVVLDRAPPGVTSVAVLYVPGQRPRASFSRAQRDRGRGRRARERDPRRGSSPAARGAGRDIDPRLSARPRPG